MKLQMTINKSTNGAGGQTAFQTTPDLKRLQMLTEADQQKVLLFLKIRPVHTVVMANSIQDNGPEKADNRGKLYGYQKERRKSRGRFLMV